MSNNMMSFFKREYKFLNKFMPNLISEIKPLTKQLDQDNYECLLRGIKSDIKDLFIDGDLSQRYYDCLLGQCYILSESIKDMRIESCDLIIISITMQIKCIIAINYGFTDKFEFSLYELLTN